MKDLHIHLQKIKHLRDRRLYPIQVIKKVSLKSYKVKLPPGCRLHPMFHCDLFSKAYSLTPLRHQPAEIESVHYENAIDDILGAKVDNLPSRRSSYLQFLTHLVGYYVLYWMLLKQVDGCERLSMFLSSYAWAQFLKHNLMFNLKLDILLEI